jgi:hypothetical protein
MRPEENKEFEDRLKSRLDQKATDLDAYSLSRLGQARAHALAQQSKLPGWLHLPDWSIAGGLATATVAVLAFSFLLEAPQGTELPPITAGDLEILAAGEDLEFYDQLDFFRWLDEEGHAELKDAEKKA